MAILEKHLQYNRLLFNVGINIKRLESLKTLKDHLCMLATAKFATVVSSLLIPYFSDRFMGTIYPE